MSSWPSFRLESSFLQSTFRTSKFFFFTPIRGNVGSDTKSEVKIEFLIEWLLVALKSQLSGLRSLGVTFPPHDSSDAGSNPAEFVEFLRTEKFREQSPPGGTLSRLTRVVNLLHVKELQAPRGPLSKIIGHFTSNVSVEALRWAGHSFTESCRLWIE
jgi:hypothetical protein